VCLTNPHRRRGKRAFDAVVVDEAQDVGIPELRFLAIAGSWCADGLFLTGDLGQRIFQQPFSWKLLGVDIRGRSYTLRLRQAARNAEIIICQGLPRPKRRPRSLGRRAYAVREPYSGARRQ
jgi:hypothetical protein